MNNFLRRDQCHAQKADRRVYGNYVNGIIVYTRLFLPYSLTQPNELWWQYSSKSSITHKEDNNVPSFSFLQRENSYVNFINKKKDGICRNVKPMELNPPTWKKNHAQLKIQN